MRKRISYQRWCIFRNFLYYGGLAIHKVIKNIFPCFLITRFISGSFVSCFILTLLSFKDETLVDNDWERIVCSDEEYLPLVISLGMLKF